MKKLFIIAIIGTSLFFQNCNTKEKQEKTDTLNDSIVTETVIIDSVATENGSAVMTEDLNIQNEPVDKSTTVTKVTVKEPTKVVTQTTTKTKVGDNTTTEVETKVVVTEEPKKTVEVEAPVKVVVKEPTVIASTSDWVVPAKYQTMKNPTTANKENIAIGKSLYSKHCKSCHGSTGLGDGTKAANLQGDLGDFSSKKYQSQSDGAIFYKSYIGRKDMPNYEKKMTEEDMWFTVNYMRTMGK
jgi:mono/diheme cytochrome c family protein